MVRESSTAATELVSGIESDELYTSAQCAFAFSKDLDSATSLLRSKAGSNTLSQVLSMIGEVGIVRVYNG